MDTLGSYLARRIGCSVPIWQSLIGFWGLHGRCSQGCAKRGNGSLSITEANRIHQALFGMQSRTFGPYLAAIDRRIHISLKVIGACEVVLPKKVLFVLLALMTAQPFVKKRDEKSVLFLCVIGPHGSPRIVIP
jgi:hypothetical protein